MHRTLTATELAVRLEAINALDVPFRVERGSLPDEFLATWRYADAKWIDLARAHGLHRTFRIAAHEDPVTVFTTQGETLSPGPGIGFAKALDEAGGQTFEVTHDRSVALGGELCRTNNPQPHRQLTLTLRRPFALQPTTVL